MRAPCILAWDPNGSALAAACEDTRIYLYDTETGRQTGVLADHTSMGIFTIFQPAGSLLASNGWDGKLRIWRRPTGEMLLTLPAGGAMEFRRDGLRFGALAVNCPVLFQVADGREYRSLVAVAGTGAARLWDFPGASPQRAAARRRHHERRRSLGHRP